MARIALPILAALLAFGAAACGGSDAAPAAESPPPSSAAVKAPVACEPTRVHYTPYPGGDERLSQIPWIAGKPAAQGLVGLLWYWPDEWRRQRVDQARIYTGGVAPQGWNVKILWAFALPRPRATAVARFSSRDAASTGPAGSRRDSRPSATRARRARPRTPPSSTFRGPAAGASPSRRES
jgi:hypothetical protein